MAIKNYAEAQELLGKKTRKKLAHETWLEVMNSQEIAVRYHNSPVVTYYKNGEIEIRSFGWESNTTKARINTYAPVFIWQEKWVWFVTPRIGEIRRFTDDGMRFTEKGEYIKR